MFFKKQSFKIKHLLQEKGIELPLVSIQEILAKSYGFNNRHIALNNDQFNKNLDSIFETREVKNNIENTPLTEMPYELTIKNIAQYSFWWFDGDIPTHYSNIQTNSPFDSEANNGQRITIMKEMENEYLKKTYLEYVFNKHKNTYVQENILSTFLLNHNKKNTLKEFNEMNLEKNDFEDILLSGLESWKDIKKLIQHKDCPIELLMSYAKSKHFYIRITAIFSKTHRKELVELAKNDNDARVRCAYYKYLIDEQNIEQVRELVKKDQAVINLMKNIYIGEEKLINWK